MGLLELDSPKPRLLAFPVVPRFRLRYQATDLEMPAGEFIVGRSSGCNLALDDALVSRRHARFVVGQEEVTVEDLGSRNGVLVNSQKTRGATTLRHLDRISIGSHDMLLVEIGRSDPRRHATSELLICLACRNPLEVGDKHCSHCGVPVPRGASTLAGATLELRIPDLGIADESDDTKQGSLFMLLAPIVEKSIRLGHYDKAAQMIGSHLESLCVLAAAREELAPELVEHATQLALGLAEGLGDARFFDFLFNFYAALGAPMASPTIDRLHQLVRQARYHDAAPLRSYLDVLQRRTNLGASERFNMRRLEGLERVISA